MYAAIMSDGEHVHDVFAAAAEVVLMLTMWHQYRLVTLSVDTERCPAATQRARRCWGG